MNMPNDGLVRMHSMPYGTARMSNVGHALHDTLWVEVNSRSQNNRTAANEKKKPVHTFA